MSGLLQNFNRFGAVGKKNTKLLRYTNALFLAEAYTGEELWGIPSPWINKIYGFQMVLIHQLVLSPSLPV